MTTTSGRLTSTRISSRPLASSSFNSYSSSYSPSSYTPSTRTSSSSLTYPRSRDTETSYSRLRDSESAVINRLSQKKLEREREEAAAVSSSANYRSYRSTASDLSSVAIDRLKPRSSVLSSSLTPSLAGRRYGSLTSSLSSSSGVTSSLEVRKVDPPVVTNPAAATASADTSPASAATATNLSDSDAESEPESDDGDSGVRRKSSAVPEATRAVADKRGLNGLRNIGNTCFMNSVLQCLSNTRPLLEYLLDNKFESDINTSTSSMKGALIKAFGDVVKDLWARGAEDKVVATSAFKSQIQRFAPRFMGYLQQDAQEFLRYLLEGLHEDVNKVPVRPKPITTDIDDNLSDSEKASEAWRRYTRMEDSKIMDIFVGQLKSTLQCTKCNHCSVTFDPFWDLSLPLPSRVGSLKLQDCLNMFAKEECLDGDEKPTCSKCQSRQKCTKKLSIHKFPKVLVLHLKRFSPQERFRGKLSNTVEFPLSGLDMSAYAANRGAPCTYSLYAVSNHSGTTYSGHYTAYCSHPYTHQWHEYNDSRVSTLSQRSIVSGEAYVLFYEMTSQSSHL